jgi:Protein of unknown function (DUF2815)
MDIRISNARISFANGLWNASAAVEGGIPKYNCDFIVTPDSKVERKTAEGKWAGTTLKEAQRLVAEEAFKGDAKKATAWFEDLDARQKSCRDGNKNKDKSGDVRQGYEGNLYVHATSKTLMPVYRGDKSIVAREEDSPVYSGCYVNARVSLYANLKPGQKGLFASLQGTQFAKDGDSFGGGAKASADDFEEVAEGSDASDFE